MNTEYNLGFLLRKKGSHLTQSEMLYSNAYLYQCEDKDFNLNGNFKLH